ncbi:MAG: hypothetical protein ABI728_07855 [Betaproteobacteria bacterium]
MIIKGRKQGFAFCSAKAMRFFQMLKDKSGGQAIRQAVFGAMLFFLGVPTFGASDCLVLDKDLQGGSYKGDCKDGLAEGYGETSGRDSYVGQFSKGKLDGQGTYTWFDGSVLTGGFVDGRPYGHGVHRYGPRSLAPGARYEGDLKDGKMEGSGVFYWADGSRYEGQFKNNKADGVGAFISSDGQRFEGHFLFGRPVGKKPPMCPSSPKLLEC